MILKTIKIKNYKNIQDIMVDFSSNSAGSDNDLQKGYFKEIGKGKILPQVNSLIGPNAVGKTNIFSALSFLDYITSEEINVNAARKVLISSIEDKTNINEDDLKIDDFLNKIKNNKINDVELENFLIRKRKILELEYLKNVNSNDKPIEISAIFWDVETKKESIIEMILSKTGFKKSKPKISFFNNEWTFNFDETSFGLANLFEGADEAYDPMLLELVEQIGVDKLKKIINIADSTISSVFKKDNKIFFRKKKSSIDMDFEHFSSGTKRILYIYSFLLKSLKGISGIFLIDEIELFLHRELAIAVIDTMNLLSKRNPNVSFIFTTHNPSILGGNIKFKQVHEIKIDSLSGNHISTKLSTLFKNHENIEAKYKKGIISKYPGSSIVFDCIYEVINE